MSGNIVVTLAQIADAEEDLHSAVEKTWNIYGAYKIASNRIRPGSRGFKKERDKQYAKKSKIRKIGNYFLSEVADGKLHVNMTASQSRDVMKMAIPWWLIFFLGRMFIQYIWDTYFAKWSSSTRYEILRVNHEKWSPRYSGPSPAKR